MIIGCAGHVGDTLVRPHLPVRFVALGLRTLGGSFLSDFRELPNLKLRQPLRNFVLQIGGVLELF